MSEICFARESLQEVRGGGRLEGLLLAHWGEIAHYHDIPLDVDWRKYEAAEESGKLRIFTVRDAGELVGYACYFFDRNPHYRGSLQAVQDVLFLASGYRTRHIGQQLITFADAHMAAEGAQATYQHSKVAHPMDPLLKRLGYEQVDSLWAKRHDRRT